MTQKNDRLTDQEKRQIQDYLFAHKVAIESKRLTKQEAKKEIKGRFNRWVSDHILDSQAKIVGVAFPLGQVVPNVPQAWKACEALFHIQKDIVRELVKLRVQLGDKEGLFSDRLAKLVCLNGIRETFDLYLKPTERKDNNAQDQQA